MIIVDDRKENITFNALEKKGLEVIVQRVEIADVLLDGGIVIERKGHDLLQSLTKGTIWAQLINLCEYEKPILCIVNENLWRDFYFNHSRWIHSSYKGFLTTIAISFPKLKLFQFSCMDDYIDFIVDLDKKIHKEGTSERPKILARKATKLSDLQENVISGVKGVSIRTAKEILKAKGSVRAVANATKEELMEIPNIGEKTAHEIVKVMGEKYE